MRALPLLLLAITLGLRAEDPPATTPAQAKPAEAPVHGAAASPKHGGTPNPEVPASPGTALAELASGNARFVAGKRVRTLDTGHDAAMRASLTGGQSPFAVVITCSDSRVPDSLIFDQEAGRIFTIREAGNAPDLQGIASAEYAVEHLGSKVIILMGHTSCGAVKAVQEANGKPLPFNLWALQAGMAGLLESNPLDPNEDTKAYLGRLEESNARRQAQALFDRSPLLRELASGKKLWIIPAIYHLDSGKVHFFKPLAPGPSAPQHE